jgi:hypothetical protein
MNKVRRFNHGWEEPILITNEELDELIKTKHVHGFNNFKYITIGSHYAAAGYPIVEDLTEEEKEYLKGPVFFNQEFYEILEKNE